MCAHCDSVDMALDLDSEDMVSSHTFATSSLGDVGGHFTSLSLFRFAVCQEAQRTGTRNDPP